MPSLVNSILVRNMNSRRNLNIENKTNNLKYPDSAESLVGSYKDGVNTPNDIPSMLSVAASYRFLPMLKAFC